MSEVPAVDDFGRVIQPADTPPPPAAAKPPTPDGNPFSQFVTPDTPTYENAPFGSRFGATFKAHVYDSLFGSSIAAGQANPVARTEQAIQGLSPEEQALARSQLTADLVDQFEASRNNENQQRVTPAQTAQILNSLWPSASGVGDYAADIGGTLAAGLTGPENLILPEVRAAQAIRAGAPIVGRMLSGVGGRMFNTGVAMAGVSAAANPFVQQNEVEAGLKPEFSATDFALAPATGFVGGAILHGATEGVGAIARSIAEGFHTERVRGALDTLARSDPVFADPAKPPLPGERVVRDDAALPPEARADAVAGPVEVPPDTAMVLDVRPSGVERPREQAAAASRDPVVTGSADAVPAAANDKGSAPFVPQQAAAEMQFRKRTLSPDTAAGGEGSGGNEGSTNTALGPDQSPQRVEAIQSLQQQGRALAEEIGVPLRQGRLEGGQDTLGQYSARYGVARVREVADFYTVAHEAGHALEQKVGTALTDLINAHGTELGSLDYDGLARRAGEGFAEWFALNLTHPVAAEKRAPGFTEAFRSFMTAHDPKLLAKLDEAALAYRAYIEAPSGARIASQVVDAQKHGWAHLKETFSELRKEGLPRTIGMVMAKAYTAMLDRYHPLDQAVRILARGIQEQQGGGLVHIDPSMDPSKQIRLFGNAKNGALVMMREGVAPYGEVGFQGPSLMDAISHATGQARYLSVWKGPEVSNFSTYLVAKRAANLWDRYHAGDLEHAPVSFSKEDAHRAMAELIQANPAFEEASQMVHQFTRNMLTRQRDAGLIKQDLYDKLVSDPFYVPLFRDVKDKPLAGKAGGGQASDGPGMTDTVKRLRGSSRDIIDPIQGIMMQTLLAERTIRHNDIIRGLAGLAERAGPSAGGIVEPIRANELKGVPVDVTEAIRNAARQRGMDPGDTELLMSSVTNAFGDDPIMGTMFKMQPASKRGEPIVFYKEAGDLKAVRFAAGKEGLALYESLMTLPQVATDVWTKVSNVTAKTLRFGVVVHPTFALTNYIKDQLALGILRSDYVPFFSGLPGVVSELRQSDAAKLYAFLGGMSPGAGGTGIREVEKADVKQLAKGSYAAARLTSFEGLSELTQITESATRNSIFAKVYDQKIKQGLSPIDAAVEAAYQGTDILDFGRYGSRIHVLRALIPFLNPHLQGLDKARRTMLEPLGRMARGDVVTEQDREAVRNAGWALGKFVGLSSTLGAMWAALMWEREEYRDATPDQKAMNLVIPIGKKVYRIPKPYELGLGFTAGEYAYAQLFQNDPRGAGQFAEAAWEVLKPPDIIAGNPLTKSYVEGQTGVSLFTGRSIVPDRLKNRDPQFQYTEKTSPLARKISDASNVISDYLNAHTNQGVAKTLGFEKPWSPMLIDNTIGNLFGSLGKEAQNASKLVAADENLPESRFEDTAFLKRFSIDPSRWSSTVQRYYEFAAQKTGEYAQASGTFDALLRSGRPGQARDWLAQLPDDKKAYAILQSGGTEEGKAAFKPDERRISPITRAQTAASQLKSVAEELLNDTLTNTETNEPIRLTKAERRDAMDNIHQLGAMEMRNALVMVGDKGYDGRKILSVKDQFEVLKAVDADVAAEVARRYATAKVYPTENVAKVWPQAKADLLRDGSQADMSAYAADAAADGYEFGGTRTKRRIRPKAFIPSAQPEAVQ